MNHFKSVVSVAHFRLFFRCKNKSQRMFFFCVVCSFANSLFNTQTYAHIFSVDFDSFHSTMYFFCRRRTRKKKKKKNALHTAFCSLATQRDGSRWLAVGGGSDGRLELDSRHDGARRSHRRTRHAAQHAAPSRLPGRPLGRRRVVAQLRRRRQRREQSRQVVRGTCVCVRWCSFCLVGPLCANKRERDRIIFCRALATAVCSLPVTAATRASSCDSSRTGPM